MTLRLLTGGLVVVGLISLWLFSQGGVMGAGPQDAGPQDAAAQHVDGLSRLSKQQFRVADGVVLAGVLNLNSVAQLPVDTTVIVELRTAAEDIAEEANVLDRRGFDYHHIPVSGAVIDSDQLTQLRDIVTASAGKLLVVHCRSANRAAMLWGAYLLEEGWTLEQTMAKVGPALTGQANRNALLTFFNDREAQAR